jgi:hypothetical protein
VEIGFHGAIHANVAEIGEPHNKEDDPRTGKIEPSAQDHWASPGRIS